MVKHLKSIFKIGFELEGNVDSRVNDRNTLTTILDNLLGGTGEMHYDGSIRRTNGTDVTFEYASPVIDYTPSNINMVIKCLDKLPELGVTTNRSCGFHTHISFPSISVEDTIWFIFWMCANNEYKKFKKLGRTNLYGMTYAKFSIFESISNRIYAGDSIHNILRDIVTNEKYRAIRIHPQGTIEWRGPRTFLNTPTHKKTVSFFKKLDLFISSFIRSIEETSVVVLDKEYKKKDVLDIAKNYLGYVSFKSNKKQTFYEKIISNPTILDKMSYKDLKKKTEEIKRAFNRGFNVSVSDLKSKSLFKWVIDNELISDAIHVFDINVVLDGANELYDRKKLYNILKTYWKKHLKYTDIILKKIEMWNESGLYKNTINLFINDILSTCPVLSHQFRFFATPKWLKLLTLEQNKSLCERINQKITDVKDDIWNPDSYFMNIELNKIKDDVMFFICKK